jgi:hypothetical protein
MLSEPGGAVSRDLERRSRNVVSRARQLAPGTMKRHISASTQSGHVRVECDHPATLYVIQGTRRHKIRPRNPGGALRFTVKGKKVFARIVMHPGTKANNFLLRALREAAGR